MPSSSDTDRRLPGLERYRCGPARRALEFRAGFPAPKPPSHNFVHAEWITLHDNPKFRVLVDFLRAELDRVGPLQADLCRDFFGRTVTLELSFFEAAYADRA